MSKQLHSMHGALLLAAILLCHSHRTFAGVGENYLSAMQGTIAQNRSNLATLAASADRAANEFLSGGNLWVAGRQADFSKATVCPGVPSGERNTRGRSSMRI